MPKPFHSLRLFTPKPFHSIRLFTSIWDIPTPTLHTKIPKSRTRVTTSPSTYETRVLYSKEKEKEKEDGTSIYKQTLVDTIHSNMKEQDLTSINKSIVNLSNQYKINPPKRPEIERSTSVIIMGTPNAGKSKLMNVLIGANISAVSPKSHTTRMNVLGVITEGDTQLVFCDTPGIMPNQDAITKSSNMGNFFTAAWSVASGSDVAILLIDASKRLRDAELQLASTFSTNFKNSKSKKVLVLNKIDAIADRTDLLPIVDQLTKSYEYDAVFMISSLTYDGVEDLKDFLFAMSKPAPWKYEPTVNTSLTPKELVSEIIREKLYLRLNQEIPYSIKQETSEWRELLNEEYISYQNKLFGRLNNGEPTTPATTPSTKALLITQILKVPKASTAKVVIGANGSTLRDIIRNAQLDIEKMLKRPIILSCKVQVEEKEKKDAVPWTIEDVQKGRVKL